MICQKCCLKEHWTYLNDIFRKSWHALHSKLIWSAPLKTTNCLKINIHAIQEPIAISKSIEMVYAYSIWGDCLCIYVLCYTYFGRNKCIRMHFFKWTKGKYSGYVMGVFYPSSSTALLRGHNRWDDKQHYEASTHYPECQGAAPPGHAASWSGRWCLCIPHSGPSCKTFQCGSPPSRCTAQLHCKHTQTM